MTKKIIVITVCVFVFGFVAKNIFDYYRPLVNPFGGLVDDHSSLVNKKLSKPPALNYGSHKELTTLENVPRYLVYNRKTGQVYYSKNATDTMSPASFTKLLSAQVALDLIPTDATITATVDSVNKIPTVLELKAGEQLLVSDLLRGAIATSANDAAQTLADGAASYQKLKPENFVYLMNKKAEYLGMTSSNFANPDGLDDPHQFTNLIDLVSLINNVEKNYPEILSAAKSDRQDIESTSTHGRYYLPNWNGLLGVYPHVNGLKIAYTENAGYSTIVTYDDGSLSLGAIVSGADSYLERDRAAADLLDAALIAESQQPNNITTSDLKRHYQQWADLANQIKAELAAIEKSKNNVP